jgi:hypothetical protein
MVTINKITVVVFFISTSLVSAKNDVIDVTSLLEERTTLQLIDLQSDYMRELQGYITQSVLVPNDENEENYIQK